MYYPIRMTINFENENDVIVYALEQIISYAQKNRYIFVAQSVWRIASVIGLSDGLVIHIDNLRIRSKASQVPIRNKQSSSEQELESALPIHLQVDSGKSQIHLDRRLQVGNTVSDSCQAECSEPESDRATRVVENAKEFLRKSRKERQAFKNKPCVLSRTRSGKIPVRPLTKKQRNRLQVIPKDTISKYLAGRDK